MRISAIIPAIMILSIWQITTSLHPEYGFLLSSPKEIFLTFNNLIFLRETWQNISFTISAAVVGLVIGTVLGTLFGLLSALCPNFQGIAHWYLLILGSIPILTLAPLITLWFGIGWLAKVTIAALGTFILCYQLSSTGAIATRDRYHDTLLLLSPSHFSTVVHLLLPGALTWVIEGYRASVSTAVLGVFIGEYINSSVGLGHMILRASSLYRIAEVWCGVILIAIAVLLLNSTCSLLLKFALPQHVRKAPITGQIRHSR